MPDNCGDVSSAMPSSAGSLWSRRVAMIILATGLVLYSLAMVSVVDESFPANADAAWFLMLSRSILSGEGYAEIEKPIPMPHTKFPPVLPCVLAAAQWISPGSLAPMKLVIAAFGFLSIIAFYLLIKRFVSDLLAALLAITVGIQLNMLLFSQQLMSDIPYIFFSLLSLFFAVKRIQSRQAGVWLEIAIGIAISLAVLTRTVGISLFAAFFIAILLDRGFRQKLRCLCVVSIILVSCVGAWEVRNVVALVRFFPVYSAQLIHNHYRDGREGLAKPMDLLKGSIRNVKDHSKYLARMTLPCLGNLRGFLPLFTLLAALGWLARLVRHRSVIEFYLAFYVLILLLWPWAFARFLLPIAGLMIFYFVHGFGLVTRSVWAASRKMCEHRVVEKPGSAGRLSAVAPLDIASVLLVIFILIASMSLPIALISSDKARYRFDRQHPWLREFITVGQWIGKHTPKDAVILTERSVSSFLISGRKSFRPRDIQARAMFRDAIAQTRLFVIQSAKPGYGTASRPIAITLERTRGYWHVVFRTGSTFVIAQNGAEVTQDRL